MLSQSDHNSADGNGNGAHNGRLTRSLVIESLEDSGFLTRSVAVKALLREQRLKQARDRRYRARKRARQAANQLRLDEAIEAAEFGGWPPAA